MKQQFTNAYFGSVFKAIEIKNIDVTFNRDNLSC